MRATAAKAPPPICGQDSGPGNKKPAEAGSVLRVAAGAAPGRRNQRFEMYIVISKP
jgi:hypothetical protein